MPWVQYTVSRKYIVGVKNGILSFLFSRGYNRYTTFFCLSSKAYGVYCDVFQAALERLQMHTGPEWNRLVQKVQIWTYDFWQKHHVGQKNMKWP